MKTSLTLALIGALAIAPAAFAETTKADIKASENAIKKDDAAIAKQEGNIEVNRAEKAAAKANDKPLDQASESVQIGANKAAIKAKEMEKSVDEKILDHQEKKVAN